jgi:nucleoside 2-deoxyribosyltransferase
LRVYIAAPWTHKAEVAAAAALFEAAGHVITKKWWLHREVPGYLKAGISKAQVKELRQQVGEDMEGVARADAFVLLNLGPSEGKAVETGLAIELGVPLFLVGPKTNLFHYHPDWTEYASVAEVLDDLTSW